MYFKIENTSIKIFQKVKTLKITKKKVKKTIFNKQKNREKKLFILLFASQF